MSSGQDNDKIFSIPNPSGKKRGNRELSGRRTAGEESRKASHFGLSGRSAFLTITLPVCAVVVGLAALFYAVFSDRFSDVVTRVEDTRIALEGRMEDMKTQITGSEQRLGQRIDDWKEYAQENRQEM